MLFLYEKITPGSDRSNDQKDDQKDGYGPLPAALFLSARDIGVSSDIIVIKIHRVTSNKMLLSLYHNFHILSCPFCPFHKYRIRIFWRKGIKIL